MALLYILEIVGVSASRGVFSHCIRKFKRSENCPYSYTQMVDERQEFFGRSHNVDDLSDDIYEQFSSSNDTLFLDERIDKDDDLPRNNISNISRPDTAGYWFLKCAAYSITILIMSIIVGLISALILYIDINTADACLFFSQDQIPLRLKQVRVTVEVIQGICLQFLHVGFMVFAFGIKLVNELNLVHLNVFAVFIDSIFRLFLQVYNQYDWVPKSYILNVVFMTVMIVNSFTIARHFIREWKLRKLVMLTFALGAQILVGVSTLFLYFYGLIPWFVTLSPEKRSLVAAALPVTGTIIKSVIRVVVENTSTYIHAGRSYQLLVGMYAGFSILFTTLRVNIESKESFLVLCFLSGFFGFLEKISVFLRDRLWMWFFEKCLKKNLSSSHYNQSHRSPRTKRLIADLSISQLIQEITIIISTTAFVKLYILQPDFKLPGIHHSEIVFDFLSRITYAVAIEYFFVLLSLFFLTWFMNIPVIRVWKKKWKTHVLINLFVIVGNILYSTHYMSIVVASLYNKDNLHVHNNKTAVCDLKELPFFNS